MNFCTYFDSNYALKGWVCNYTLHYQNPDSILYILCLDDDVYKTAANLKNVIPIKLIDVENYFPELLIAKTNRLLKEYYATLSPILPLYIFKNFSIDSLYYTDADMAFWFNPLEIEKVMGNHSLMVVDHGFEPPRAGIRFNVGILGYKNDDNCIRFLNWWKDRCLEWCKWETHSGGMFADQGYLNIIYDQPEKFENALICPHPGINMGPWNIGKYTITKNKKEKPIVDNKYNLVCYHYHEFRMININSYYPTGWKHSKSDREIVYDPYFKLIQKSSVGKLF